MAKSNYADSNINDSLQGALPEHRDRLSNDPRSYTPSDGEHEGGIHNKLVIDALGDPFWKPQRYKADKGWIWSREMIDATYPNGYEPNVRIQEPAWRTAELEAQMPTFRGVPKSGAEYRNQARAA